MATGELNFGVLTICRVGDVLEVTAEHAQIGSWAFTTRILWLRAGHIGLTPPDSRWQSLIEKDGRLTVQFGQRNVTATLTVRVVGITQDLPPVLVVRQEGAATPLRQDGPVAIERPYDAGRTASAAPLGCEGGREAQHN